MLALIFAQSSGSPTISASVSASLTPQQIVDGGETIVITLANDTWVTAGATFDAQRQNIINGLDSAQSETNGWNNEVRDTEVVGSVARTSDTVVTITLTAAASYAITNNETITVTIPATALTTSASDITGIPTFTISASQGWEQVIMVRKRGKRKRRRAVLVRV